MRRYKIISPCAERDARGRPTGRVYAIGELVHMSDEEGERLTRALCAIEYVEAQMVTPPENRVLPRRGRSRRS